MLGMRICLAVVAIVGALTTNALAQNDPPCRLGFFPFAYAGGATLEAKAGTPFSATVKWTFDRRLADGNAIHAVERTVQARDSAGRTRIERAQGCWRGEDGQLHPRTDVTIFDPATKTTMSWVVGWPPQKIVFVSRRVAPVPKPPPTAEEQAAALERRKLVEAEQAQQGENRTILLGTMTIRWLLVEGTRYVRTIPAGSEGNQLAFASMREYWVSKDLGITMKSVFDDPRRGRSAFELEDTTLQEPDPTLFAPPPGYEVKEMHP
jgi:hypothetical protein